MGSAHGVPHVRSDRASITRVIGFAPCRSDRCCHDGRCFSSQTCGRSEAAGAGQRHRLELLLFHPYRPCDARELVGQRARGLVVIGAPLHLERLGLQAIERSAGPLSEHGGAQHGARAVGEEHAQVAVALELLCTRFEKPGSPRASGASSDAAEPAVASARRRRNGRSVQYRLRRRAAPPARTRGSSL